MPFCRSSYAWKTLLVLLTTFPLVLLCASLTGKRFRNDLTEWVNQETVVARQFAGYRDKFGINEYVLMTWPSCSPSDTRLTQVEADLNGPDAEQWVDLVSSGATIRRSLIREAGLTQQQANRRLSGFAIGKDGESTGVFLTLSAKGRSDRSEALAAIQQIAGRYVDEDQIRWAGLGRDLFVLDDEGFRSPFRMVPWIMLSALLLTWFFVRDLRLAFFINALGTYCGCLSFTFIYVTNADLNAIVWPLPTLMMLLTISASLHFLGYYRSAASQHAAQDLPGDSALENCNATVVQNAWSEAWRPTLCCAATTAVGLLSLTFSQTEPVRQFGWFGSASILASSGVTLLSLPAWLVLFPPPIDRRLPSNSNAAETKFWSWLACRVRDQRTKLIAISVLLLALSAWAIPSIRTSSNLPNFFPSGHRVLTDARSIESGIGPLSSIEILLEFQNAQTKNDVDRVRLINALGQKIIRDTRIESVVSAATFSPLWRTRPGPLQAVVQRRKVDRLKKELVPLKLLHVSTTDNSQSRAETWRMSLRYSGLESIDVSSLARRSVELAKKQFQTDSGMILQGEHLDVIATGEFVLFANLDRQFLTDLVTTYYSAFALVMAIVLIIMRSVKSALLAAIPNLLPAMLVFGAAGWLDYSLDVASLMTASVALGIAVDDTLHLLIWWEKRRSAGEDSHQSLISALTHCGAAVVQTSVVCGLSIGLYAFCGFLPTVRFGILLLVMLLVALLGDLLILPALLSTELASKKTED